MLIKVADSDKGATSPSSATTQTHSSAPVAAVPRPAAKQELIADIKPAPIKDRSHLGIVELTLGKGQKVRAVGVVYGIEHWISGDGYSAQLFLDQYNQRIKVINYDGENLDGLIDHLIWLARENDFDKTIFMAFRNDWQRFLRRGFVLEAVVKYYHVGNDAYVMSRFGSQPRLSSHCLFEEIELIEKIMSADAPPKPNPAPEGIEFRMAKRTDIPELITLYQDIFETYPSPLIHSEYLGTIFNQDSIFAVATQGGEILSAASAELNPSHKAAELTDCATRRKARGMGLMSHILGLLEQEVAKRDYVCAYTMARARSFGMNNVFYRLGYEFSGRLVNNCDIYGAYEDMNIWIKNLKSPV